jgi:spermidine synthase
VLIFAAALKEWSQGAKINTDRNLRLQYLAGLALNKQVASDLLGSVLKYYEFPQNDLFVGSDERLRDLEARLVDAGRANYSGPRRARRALPVAAKSDAPSQHP